MAAADRADSRSFLERLSTFALQPAHRVIGLMSGTSADGVDAALVRREEGDSGLRASLEAYLTVPYAPGLREQVLAAAGFLPRRLAQLDVLLGEEFAHAARRLMKESGRDRSEVDLIGSHGQTICHHPEERGGPRCTVQIGSPAVIAERTGLPVVSDFRVRDMVLGGEGAPLVPLADRLLLGRQGEIRVLLNLGGIANLTALRGREDDLIAFDTGPGNALLDALTRLSTNGLETFDRDGARAARGQVKEPLLAELLEHPFLRKPPPRSADRDLFGAPLAARILARKEQAALDDLLATAAEFTVRSVVRAIRELPPPYQPVDRVIVSGGGVHNRVLLSRLSDELSGTIVETSDIHGIPADAKEAIAFAVLARETLLGRPGNVPAATGASKPAVLGSITP
ncbi:MAG: anhydro-N-acetylmuramic acid kinase [Planctomycetota bacterium]